MGVFQSRDWPPEAITLGEAVCVILWQANKYTGSASIARP